MEEIIDKETGAILFKRSPEQRMLEALMKQVKELEERVKELEDQLNTKKKEDS